jgi:parvulin-like peptidyl-prolyl isomerase
LLCGFGAVDFVEAGHRCTLQARLELDLLHEYIDGYLLPAVHDDVHDVCVRDFLGLPVLRELIRRMRSAYFLLLLGISSTTFAQTAADDVLVTRGGVSVTLQDVDTFAARVPKEQREKFIDSPSRIRDMLNNMLLTKQLAVQARAAHLDQQSDVESQLRAAQDEVLARARMADFTKSIDVPDLTKLVREQYVTHKELYKVPAVVDVKQLLISAENHSGDEARALAEKVRSEALADPKNFDALVEKYSDDNSKASNHGLMKDATNSQYVQEFRDVAGALTKVG